MKPAKWLLLLVSAGSVGAQETGAFQPPQAHDVHRYEAGWDKNPFTLKTAPPVVESISFARDLAIGTYYGDSADPTIIIVNTKTNERTRLRQGQPAANGMKLTSVKSGAGRKDMVVEVTLGSETAAIRYNDAYMKQVAAAEMTRSSSTPSQTRQQPAAQQKTPPPSSPPPRRGAPATAQNVPSSSDQPDSPVAPGLRDAGSPSPSRPPPPPPLVSQSASPGAPAQMPVRNRLTVPVRNVGTLSHSSPVPLPP